MGTKGKTVDLTEEKIKKLSEEVDNIEETINDIDGTDYYLEAIEEIQEFCEENEIELDLDLLESYNTSKKESK